VAADRDPFGGFKTVKAAATGRFRVERVGGRWWFITPEGHGFVALAVNHVGELKIAAHYQRTVFSKRFGQDWSQVFEEVTRLYQSWGFNCGGFAPPEEMRDLLPFAVSAGFVPAAFYQEPFSYVDVFDPAFARTADERARAAATSVQGRAGFMGYAWNDCVCWDLDQARRSHGSDWVSWIRALPASAPGRQRYAAFLRENPAAGEDDRAFLRLIARQYFRVVGEAFRRHDPHGLILGERFKLRDHPDEVLEEARPYTDVLAIQPGDHWHPSPLKLHRPDETWFDGEAFDRLHKLTGKPIIICDHQCGFFDPATPQTGTWFQYASAEEAAASYDRFLRDAFAKPYIIGYFRCQLLSRWMPKVRQYKQGLLRPDGTPFQEYVPRITRTNQAVLKALQ
jgi:hypothetical protein